MRAMIEKYGIHWERAKMFSVKDGRVSWTDEAWPEDAPDLEGAKGVYVLYRGERPIYVGLAIQGNSTIGGRIHAHTKDWLAPWWDSVCWYAFEDNDVARMVESLLISHLPGIWNGAESGRELYGRECFIGKAKNYASVELWDIRGPQHGRTADGE